MAVVAAVAGNAVLIDHSTAATIGCRTTIAAGHIEIALLVALLIVIPGLVAPVARHLLHLHALIIILIDDRAVWHTNTTGISLPVIDGISGSSYVPSHDCGRQSPTSTSVLTLSRLTESTAADIS